MTQPKKTPKYPAGWPNDERGRFREFGGRLIGVHPEREPVEFNYETGKWELLKIKPSATREEPSNGNQESN